MDLSQEYGHLTYQVVNDSTIKLIESIDEPNMEGDEPAKIKKSMLTISSKVEGKIVDF